ncbi:MAG: hypothetical protein ACLFS3_01645 [Candidatus Aenigmatarchaeota archaeon]
MLEVLDWKLMISLVMAFFLLTAGLVKDVGQGIQEGELEKVPQNFFQRVKERTDLSDFSMNVPVTREIHVKGSFENEDGFEFDSTSVDKILLTSSSESLNMTADGKRVTASRDILNISLSDFKGQIEVSENELTFEGNTGSLRSDAINIEGSDFSVENQGQFKRLELAGISLKKLKLENVSGTIESNSGVTIPLDKNPTELSGFLGNMTFSDGNVDMEGDVNRVYSEKNRTKTVLSS